VERFPVKLGDYGNSSGSRLQQLSQHQIKLNLQAIRKVIDISNIPQYVLLKNKK